MPFKSEKQRRFLWATRPDIAKKWADKYPESNKGLPMYAADKDNKNDKSQPKEKAAQINIWSLFSKNEGSGTSASPSILPSNLNENFKKADSKQERVDIPRSEKPVYAGEEREKGMISSGDDLGDKNNESCGPNAINELLQKLSVVLAPKIEQTMENLEAEREGRVPRRVGNNAGLKHYPVATPQIPLPMGMQQAQASPQTQQTKPASPTPVGAGQSSATTDPIKFHSGLSMSGIINGNASLSAPNTVNTKISAAKTTAKKKKPPANTVHLPFGPLAGGILAGSLLSKALRAGYRNYTQGDYDDSEYPVQDFQPDYDRLNTHFKSSSSGDPIQGWLMGMDHVEPDTMLDILAEERVKSAVEKWAYDIGNRRQSTNVVDRRTPEPSWMGKMLGYKAEPTDLSPSTAGLARANDSVLDKVLTNHHPSYSPNNRHTQAVARAAMDQQSRLSPTPSAVAVNNQIAVAENDYNEWKGRPPVNYDGRPADVRMRRPTGLPLSPREEKTPVPQSGITAETQGAFKRYTPPQAPPSAPPQPNMLQKNSASTPAWQRAAGKNDEGGLNAKGRASYNRETGGNLKAPVTEKNPTGERDKRQNSFCSRMCGMKRVNTGSKTKKDPDSRINKSLRKWNCKCGSFENVLEKWSGDGLSMAPVYGALLGAAGGAVGNAMRGHTGNDVGRLLNYAAGTDYDATHPGVFPSRSFDNLARNMAEGAVLGGGAGVGYDVLRNVLTSGAKPAKKKKPATKSAAESFGKEAAKRVLNLSPSWGGQKWQLGEWGLNPQVGYRYLGGVMPTPDIALRLGGPLGGTALGFAPFPYIETDWGRPSGRQANKETRSLYKWIGDGMRDRPTAAAHALANVPEDATAEDYEAAMRSSGVGYSSRELKRLADRMAKMGPLQLPVE